MTYQEAKDAFTRSWLASILSESDSVAEAAKAAGLNRTYLHRLIELHNIPNPHKRHLGQWEKFGL